MNFQGFDCQKLKKYMQKLADFLYSVLVSNQKYKKLIKDFYIIFAKQLLYLNDPHFYYIFLQMNTTLAGSKNSLKKTLIPTPPTIIVQQNLTKLVFVLFLILKGTFDFKSFGVREPHCAILMIIFQIYTTSISQIRIFKLV